MSLKVRLTVSSTDHPEYEHIVFGTYEVEFDIEEFLKDYPRPLVWRRQIEEMAGVTLDSRLAFLDFIEVIPRMRFGKPSNPDDPAGSSK